MAQHEIEKMLLDSQKPDDEPTIKLSFEKGETVMIREGAFENYEGTVDELFPEKGMVRVLVSIFGRQARLWWTLLLGELKKTVDSSFADQNNYM